MFWWAYHFNKCIVSMGMLFQRTCFFNGHIISMSKLFQRHIFSMNMPFQQACCSVFSTYCFNRQSESEYCMNRNAVFMCMLSQQICCLNRYIILTHQLSLKTDWLRQDYTDSRRFLRLADENCTQCRFFPYRDIISYFMIEM